MNPGSSESDRSGGAQEGGKADQPQGKGKSTQRDGEPKPKASDRAEKKTTPKASDRAQEKSSPKSDAQGQKDDKGRPSRAEGSDRGKDGPKQSDKGSGDRVQLSEEKRTSIGQRMSKSARGNRVTNVNFDIRVGVSVPRSTTLHVLPSDVVEIVPE